MTIQPSPTDTFIGKIIGKSCDVLNEIHPLPENEQVPRFEGFFVAGCVAIVCGALPGIIIGKLGLPVYMVPPLSFATSWWVCENLLPTGHKYFGSKTIWHRVYDVTSVCYGITAYYLVK